MASPSRSRRVPNRGVSPATPFLPMASPRAESRRQGVGRTPHERKADAHLGKKRRRRLARAGEKARSDARTGRERELRAEEIACLCTHAGTPHRCSAPIERERRKERRGGREEDGGRTWNRAREKQREQRVCAGIARLHLPERPHLCRARIQREGRRRGRRRGASVQLHPQLGPAAPMPSAATNPVRLHLHPGARRLVPRVVRSASSSSQSARSARTSSSPFLCSIAYAWLAWTWIYYALFCFLR
jgi:hypothetical protein